MKDTEMDNQTRDKVLAIIREATNMDPNAIDPEADLQTQISLDSMQYVSLTSKIEIALDVELPLDVIESQTLNDFMSKIDTALEEREE
jgi:acyl carrier protein